MSLYQFFAIMHVFGLDIGLGACSVTYVIAFIGLFKPDVMRASVRLFSMISVIIWIGLFLLIASGIGLVIVAGEMYGEDLYTWPFYLKLIATGIAAFNGVFLNVIVTPAWEKVVKLDNFTKTPEYRRVAILGIIGGAISFGSWYGAFVLGMYVFRIMLG